MCMPEVKRRLEGEHLHVVLTAGWLDLRSPGAVCRDRCKAEAGQLEVKAKERLEC